MSSKFKLTDLPDLPPRRGVATEAAQSFLNEVTPVPAPAVAIEVTAPKPPPPTLVAVPEPAAAPAPLVEVPPPSQPEPQPPPVAQVVVVAPASVPEPLREVPMEPERRPEPARIARPAAPKRAAAARKVEEPIEAEAIRLGTLSAKIDNDVVVQFRALCALEELEIREALCQAVKTWIETTEQKRAARGADKRLGGRK